MTSIAKNSCSNPLIDAFFFFLFIYTECQKAIVPHGFVVGPYNDTDTVYYTCDEDYKLVTKGWWGEAKCIGGVWSGLQQCIGNASVSYLMPYRSSYNQHDFRNTCKTRPKETFYTLEFYTLVFALTVSKQCSSSSAT